ncbi:DUF4167 domain-containing protein [uncultured Paracoccus sp.]|uniref:DUF4167 domain-containing protein n=1 Tax=uncultured Paracoccus sp. TaxID=189685 RepID=UPI0025EDC1CB|nr:DUF4167 domain-containing protein [uncultured Paracoccus sp.]
MRSSKSRSRNKSNRQRSLGNIVNRVFDSSGPEGKVRGTPQQIIEKYLTLARDAQLSNDRVAEQSFLQHAEHYTRLLGEAQREQAERQQQQQASQRDDDTREDGGDPRNGGGRQGENGSARHRGDQQPRSQAPRQDEAGATPDPQPVVEAPAPEPESGPPAVQASDIGLPPVIATDDEAGPVETPEATADTAAAPEPPQEAPRAAPRRRTTRSTTPRTRKKPADPEPPVSKEPASEG